MNLINNQVEIENAHIDFEEYGYINSPQSREEEDHNMYLFHINRYYYDLTRDYLGQDIPLGRWGHMFQQDWPKDEYGGRRVFDKSLPTDPINAGYSIPWYNAIDQDRQEDVFKETTAFNTRYGINKGDLWISLPFCIHLKWLPKNLPLFEQTSSGSGFYVVPIASDVTHHQGGLINHWWFQDKVYGESQRNSRFPNMDKIHTVWLWPGIFRKPRRRYTGVTW